MRIFRPLFPLCAFFLSTAALAQKLPETGQIDDGKVVAARYGRAAAPAAVPGAAAADWGDGITGVFVESEARSAGEPVPLTFGQVFAPGDLKRNEGLSGRLADGAAVPLQLDVKATHPDGSVRHAVISAVLPAADTGGARSLALALVKDKAGGMRAGTAASAQGLLDAGFTATASATIGGQAWTASADKLLRGKPALWLDGPLVSEWLVAAPLRNDKGAEHPRLSARFAVRWYKTLGKARVDVTIENTWAFQQAPRNETYDAAILVGGKEVYAKRDLVHFNQARWRKTFWWGEVPAIHIRHDTAYLIASRALPNYDRSLRISGRALAGLKSEWQGPKTEPMGIGLAIPYMPTTGGRNDIGLLPSWAVIYLLNMDRQSKDATLGTADLAGSWSMHFRDRRTGRPVSLIDYPYMTRAGHQEDTRNPRTGKLELFPPCSGDACNTPYTDDIPHQPSFAYLPYLVSGDAYHLEELEFWGMYDVFSSNPGYRDQAKGLLKSDQVRGQAWALRTLGEAAYIAPDDDPLKAHFQQILKHNLDWYNAEYTRNRSANKLGFIANGYAIVYKDGTGLAPWQDDFFTQVIGHLDDLGFSEAGPLLRWKATFPILRMTAPGMCWIDGSIYALIVRDSYTSPFYTTMEQAWKASHGPDITALDCNSPALARALQVKPGEMTGFSDSPVGFPSNMQPALAYAADAGGEAGREAWRRFMSRSVKPDYSTAPQFAIVPRKTAAPTAPEK